MQSKFDRDKKKLFDRIWSYVPEKYKPIIIVIIGMAVLVGVFLSGRNLNFQPTTLKTNMPIKRRVVILFGRFTIEEIIVKKVIDKAGIITAMSM